MVRLINHLHDHGLFTTTHACYSRTSPCMLQPYQHMPQAVPVPTSQHPLTGESFWASRVILPRHRHTTITQRHATVTPPSHHHHTTITPPAHHRHTTGTPTSHQHHTTVTYATWLFKLATGGNTHGKFEKPCGKRDAKQDFIRKIKVKGRAVDLVVPVL